MDSQRFRRRWLAACVVAALLANWAGGFSVVVTALFVVVFLTGRALIGPGEEAGVDGAGVDGAGADGAGADGAGVDEAVPRPPAGPEVDGERLPRPGR